MMYPLIHSIKSRQDLVNMNLSQQTDLCQEIRSFLVEKVSRTGGHLAPNLGVVELSLALERNMNTAVDRLVWDVGHQAYVHKILTGRADNFDSLRTMGGLSGFPKVSEDWSDSFNTGHSSTSVSAAFGMALSRDLKGENYKVACVIGDGALTGGMAYEAINDISDYHGQLLIILNDNGMSISSNKGGLSKSLGKLRVSRGYQRAKHNVKSKLSKNCIGRFISKGISLTFSVIKRIFVKGQFFESLGLKYIGTIDGHDLDELNYYIKNALSINSPVVLHVNTIKGMGYKFASDSPDKFHGIGPFDPESGATLSSTGLSWSKAAIQCLCDVAAQNDNIVSVVAAMASGTSMNLFEKSFPHRFFDAAIAEQHAVTMAAGMAISGLVPVVDIYSTFLQRSYDQILHDVCLQNLHVVFLIDRSGVVGEDGETHQGLYDYSFMRPMPNMTILEPYDLASLQQCIKYATLDATGPVAIRYPRGSVPETDYVSPGISCPNLICSGGDVAILTTGIKLPKAIEIKNILNERNINCSVINCLTTCPAISPELETMLSGYAHVAVIEASCAAGGYGEAVQAHMSKVAPNTKVYTFGYPNVPITHGRISQVDHLYGLTATDIADSILREINAT